MTMRQNHFDVLLRKIRDMVDKYIEDNISYERKRGNNNWDMLQNTISELREEIKKLKGNSDLNKIKK